MAKMNDNNQIEDIAAKAELLENVSEDVEEINLAGYQVTKAELFSHTKEPAITVWENRVKFNMACLRKFPGVTHIQILIHPEQKRLIIRPCKPDSLTRFAGQTAAEKRNLRIAICFAGYLQPNCLT